MQATQPWNESTWGWSTAWNKWKRLSLSIFQRNKIAMARVSPIYSLQLIEQHSWRTSGWFMRIAVSTCCPIVQLTDERINVINSYDMENLIRKYHDDNPTVHFPIFSATEAKNSSLTEDPLLCLILQDLRCWNSAVDWILLHCLDFHSYWKLRGNWCLSAFYIRC